MLLAQIKWLAGTTGRFRVRGQPSFKFRPGCRGLSRMDSGARTAGGFEDLMD